MSSTSDERPVQALGAHRPDPPFRERVGPWRPERGADHIDELGAENLVERSRVLRVPVVDEDGGALEPTVDREVPGLLGHPGRVRVLGHPGDVDPAGGELDEEQDVERPQPDGLHGEEVGGQDAVSLASEEHRPGRTGASGRRPQAGSLEDPPDGRGAHPDPQLAKLATDPRVPPPRVLPCETSNQGPHLRIDWRPAGPAPRVGPLPSHEFAVPAHQGLRRDQERRPAVSRQGPGERGQQRAVEVPEPWSADLPTEDAELVTQDQDLEVLRSILARTLTAPAREASEDRECEPGQHGRRDGTDALVSARIGVLAPFRMVRPPGARSSSWWPCEVRTPTPG